MTEFSETAPKRHLKSVAVRNIVSLEKYKKEQRDFERRKRMAKITSRKLRRWSRAIPAKDREQMAKNMDGIIIRYGISASKLDWQQDYSSISAINRDLSRCRLSHNYKSKKRLIGSPDIWLRITEYVQKYLRKQNLSISFDALIEQLTLGTDFHHIKLVLTDEDKILVGLQRMADHISAKYNLINHYERSADLQSRYFKNNNALLSSTPYLGVFSGCFNLTINEYFSIFRGNFEESIPDKSFIEFTDEDWGSLLHYFPHITGLKDLKLAIDCTASIKPDRKYYFFPDENPTWEELDHNARSILCLKGVFGISAIGEKTFADLSKDDWRIITNLFKEEMPFLSSIFQLEMFEYRTEIYKNYCNPAKCIMSEAILKGICYCEIRRFPNVFLGYCNYEIMDYVDSAGRHELSNYYKEGVPNAPPEPAEHTSCNNFDDAFHGATYLVLLPDLHLGRMSAYILNHIEEGCASETSVFLSTDDDGFYYSILRPSNASRAFMIQPLKEILVEEHTDIYKELLATAELSLAKDPYINLEIDRVDRINGFMGCDFHRS